MSYCEETEHDDLTAAWLYLGAGCIAAYDQDPGRSAEERRPSLDRLEQQVQEHWRAMVGAVDFADGFTTAEEVFQRDMWDLPTMAMLAGVPVATLPATLRAWARTCGSVAVGDAGRALASFNRAREHRFASDLARRRPGLGAFRVHCPALAAIRVALTGGGGGRYHVPHSDLRRYSYGGCRYARPATDAATYPLFEMFGEICKKCSVSLTDAPDALWRASSICQRAGGGASARPDGPGGAHLARLRPLRGPAAAG
ncbi:hypothetical protein [Streptomyces sp. NPDC051636]|uniref:hypothetical protein n=1 Tax=Streptomyces sp. NPDC051636 TaxID=3365663 RepID=UPI00379EBCE7